MFCCKCGTQIADDAEFCHKCGAAVIHESGQSDTSDKSQATAGPGAPGNPTPSARADKSNHHSDTNLDATRNPPRKSVIIVAFLAFMAILGVGVMMFSAYVKEKNVPLDSSPPSETNDFVSTNSAPATQEGNSNVLNEEVQRAYAQKVQELVAENEDLLFDLIDLTDNDVPELVADSPGYYIRVFSWTDGEVVVLGDECWSYGLSGNLGYDYLPGESLIHCNYTEDAGSIQYDVYLRLNSANELVELPMEPLSVWYFRDKNKNGLMDEDELFIDEPIYYIGDNEVSKEVYAKQQIAGDFEPISGTKTAKKLLSQLNSESESGGTTSEESLLDIVEAYNFLGMSVDSIMEEWGTPLEFTEGGGVNYCTYDGITFFFDYQHTIYNVEMSPGICRFGSTTLNKDRLGLIDVLGIPTNEYWGTDTFDNEVYCMQYDNFEGTGGLRIELISPDGSICGIIIW